MMYNEIVLPTGVNPFTIFNMSCVLRLLTSVFQIPNSAYFWVRFNISNIKYVDK